MIKEIRENMLMFYSVLSVEGHRKQVQVARMFTLPEVDKKNYLSNQQFHRSCYYQLRQVRVVARSLTFSLMLLSSLFMLLYSAALTIAVPSSLASRGFGWRS